jgi:hypothetical protein
VQGESDRLTLYIGKAADYKLAMKDPNVQLETLGDLKRVSYWVDQGPNGTLGLFRQEIPISTSADALAEPTYSIDGAGKIQLISDKVVSVTFQYHDGQSWQDEWDGTEAGDDGKSPIGPPMAIAIDLEMRSSQLVNGQPQTRTYHHVVLIPTANGNPVESTINPPGATTSSSSSK